MINHKNTFCLPIAYLLMVCAVYAINLPMPQDDLLRDMVAVNYSYDYTKLYIHAPFLAQYNQYIMFDHILSFLSSILGNVATVHLIQVLCFIMFVTPSIMIYYRVLRKNPYCYFYITMILLVLLNNFTMLRIVLARPEMIFTCWVMWGLWLRIGNFSLTKLIWFAAGVLLIPTYWLAFFYVPSIFVVFVGWKRKLVMAVIYTLLVALFWQYYSHYQWVASILDLGKLNSNRLAAIGENKSIFIIFLNQVTAIAVVIYGYSYKNILMKIFEIKHINPKDIITRFRSIKLSQIKCNGITANLTFLLLTFFAINMIRYSAIISGIFCILLAYRLNELKIELHAIWRYIALCLAIFIPLTIDCYHSIPHFKLPDGTKILATSQSNYFVPFYSKGVQVAPAMEIGANNQDIQKMMRSIDIDGTISCDMLKKYQFDFLVERNLTQIPSCLKIYQIQKSWRAWKVVN